MDQRIVKCVLRLLHLPASIRNIFPRSLFGNSEWRALSPAKICTIICSWLVWLLLILISSFIGLYLNVLNFLIIRMYLWNFICNIFNFRYFRLNTLIIWCPVLFWSFLFSGRGAWTCSGRPSRGSSGACWASTLWHSICHILNSILDIIFIISSQGLFIKPLTSSFVRRSPLTHHVWPKHSTKFFKVNSSIAISVDIVKQRDQILSCQLRYNIFL